MCRMQLNEIQPNVINYDILRHLGHVARYGKFTIQVIRNDD